LRQHTTHLNLLLRFTEDDASLLPVTSDHINFCACFTSDQTIDTDSRQHQRLALLAWQTYQRTPVSQPLRFSVTLKQRTQQPLLPSGEHQRLTCPESFEHDEVLGCEPDDLITVSQTTDAWCVERWLPPIRWKQHAWLRCGF